MTLLDLPPELLRMVLLHSSTPSFVQLIRTCRTIFNLAADSRDVVQHHLESIPGQSLADSNEKTARLFLILRQRAAASLQGVNITADRHDFHFPACSTNITASSITSINSCTIALVWKGSARVQIFEAFQGELKLKGLLNPLADNYCPLQTAFDELNNVWVVYSNQDITEESAVLAEFYAELPERERVVTTLLTRIKLCALSPPRKIWYLRWESSPRAVSIAAHGGDKVAIAWETDTCVDHVKCRPITLHTLINDVAAHSFCVNRLPDDVLNGGNVLDPAPEYCKYAASRIAFSSGGSALKCYSAGSAAPTSRIQKFSRTATDNVSVNKLGLDLDTVFTSTEFFFIEDPFFGYHASVNDGHSTLDPHTCHSVRLSFATVKLSSHSQTIACILRSYSTVPEDECAHAIKLDEPHAVHGMPHIRVVARLWGFKLPTSNMTAVMAFAQNGTRIAIAYWDKILVWALQPDVLAGKLIGGEWVHDWIYERTVDENLKCSLVELKPILLKADAVVHKMAFTASENELVTITDRSVQIWNLGPSAIGRRTGSLLCDSEEGEGQVAETERIPMVQGPQRAKTNRGSRKACVPVVTRAALGSVDACNRFP